MTCLHRIICVELNYFFTDPLHHPKKFTKICEIFYEINKILDLSVRYRVGDVDHYYN